MSVFAEGWGGFPQEPCSGIRFIIGRERLGLLCLSSAVRRVRGGCPPGAAENGLQEVYDAVCCFRRYELVPLEVP